MKKLAALVLLLAAPCGAHERHHHGGAGPPVLPSYRGQIFPVPTVGGAASAPPTAPAAAQRRWFGGPQKLKPLPPGRVEAQSAAPAGAFQPPSLDQRGKPLSAKAADVSKSAALVQQTLANTQLAASAQALAGMENDGHFHWYKAGGVRMSHWHDQNLNRDWIGFYRGGAYLWTVSWHDHFWWQEPNTGRWLVFWRNQWWWHSPENEYFVYIGGKFYEWNPQGGAATLTPATEVLPDRETVIVARGTAELIAPDARLGPKPVSSDETMVVSKRPEFVYSADGSRVVEIAGDTLTASLYDSTKMDADGGNHFVKELGSGVTGVSFSPLVYGEPLKITLTRQDASGAVRDEVLDADGNSLGSSSAARRGSPTQVRPAVIFGQSGKPGFDAPAAELPPSDAPMPDGN